MEQNDTDRFGRAGRPRIWSGVILIIAGALLFAYKLGAGIPPWIFSWPMLLILIGLISGLKSKFHNAGSFIMVIVGSVFLVDQIVPKLNFHNFILPALLIGVGLIYILKPKRHSWINKQNQQAEGLSAINTPPPNYYKIEDFTSTSDPSEYLEIKNAFGGIKRNIISKNFKGGEIHNFMSGTELNLLQADMQHPIVLEIHNIFGGTKLLVPSNWDVKNEISVVFGGIEDKRNMIQGVPDPAKQMVLKGTCVFAGIEIANY